MSGLPREGDSDAAPAEPKPSRARAVIGWAAGLVVALVIAWAVVHVVITPVNPSQEAPEDHYVESAPCWACHFVTDSVPVQAASDRE